MMVKYKWSNDQTVLEGEALGLRKAGRNQVRRLGNALWPLIYLRRDRSRKFSPLLFFRSRIPVKMINRYDVLSLYYVCDGLLAPENLKGVEIPIVWRLSDMWPFTGGCHYSGGCERYEEVCGRCPIIASKWDNDLSRVLWKRKKTAFAGLKLTVVAPSRWIADCAGRSSLLRHAEIAHIPTGVDTHQFRPLDKESARKELGLPLDRKCILFGSVGAYTDKRKGFSVLQEAISMLTDSQSDITLITFGQGGQAPLGNDLKRLPIKNFGKIEDNRLLTKVYSSADVFVAPSLEENLPNTAIEAMSCGTPVVAFSIGGMPDLIEHGRTGYLAKPFDPVDLAKGIALIAGTREQLSDLRAGSRIRVERDFNIETIAERYWALYQELAAQARQV